MSLQDIASQLMMCRWQPDRCPPRADPGSMGKRRCPKCKQTKPLRAFNRKDDHYQSYCKECSAENNRKAYWNK